MNFDVDDQKLVVSVMVNAKVHGKNLVYIP